jgi:hypothetical protein
MQNTKESFNTKLQWIFSTLSNLKVIYGLIVTINKGDF